jgi:hypothetical protein
MKIDKKEKIESIGMTAVWEGNGQTAGKMTAIRKLLGELGNKEKACRRDSPAPFETTGRARRNRPREISTRA